MRTSRPAGTQRAAAARARLAVVAVALALAGSAAAPGAHASARLATAPGDGGVWVDVDAYGAFGYRTYGNGQGGPGDAMYDPVGAVGPSSTSWQSGVFFGMPPQGTFLTVGAIGQATTTGLLPDPGFVFEDGTTAISRFAHAGLDWALTQWVEEIFSGGVRVGTLLVQEYVVSDLGPAPVAFDLVRYYEGDLWLGLGAGVPDGGGRLVLGADEFVFETDLAGEPADTTNLVGITACGGTVPAAGRYEVNVWPPFPDRINAGLPLADVVFGDGPDADEFVDAGADYDVGIALANRMTLAPGESVTYLTTTVFGTLPPSGATGGCAVRRGPVADAGPDRVVCPGTPVVLDGTGSRDQDAVPGGAAPSWTWDLDLSIDSDGNGDPTDDVDRSGAIVPATFPPGTTVVQLTFTDDDGETDTVVVTITVADVDPPVIDCTPEVVAVATSFAGGPAAPMASAVDACDPAPALVNDRTPGGGDATDDYPCGSTLVTFTATDATGNASACATLVRVEPPPGAWQVGPSLRVHRLGADRPSLDWSLMGAVPPELRFAVLRGESRSPPTSTAPGADALAAQAWDDPDTGGSLVFYDVRSVLCDLSRSLD